LQVRSGLCQQIIYPHDAAIEAEKKFEKISEKWRRGSASAFAVPNYKLCAAKRSITWVACFDRDNFSIRGHEHKNLNLKSELTCL